MQTDGSMARADAEGAIRAGDIALAACENIRRLLIDAWPKTEGTKPDGK